MRKPWESARRTFLDMCNSLDSVSLQSLQRLATAEQDVLLSLDPSFELDREFLMSAASKSMQNALQAKVLRLLPSQESAVTVAQAMHGGGCSGVDGERPMVRRAWAGSEGEYSKLIVPQGRLVLGTPPAKHPRPAHCTSRDCFAEMAGVAACAQVQIHADSNAINLYMATCNQELREAPIDIRHADVCHVRCHRLVGAVSRH